MTARMGRPPGSKDSAPRKKRDMNAVREQALAHALAHLKPPIQAERTTNHNATDAALVTHRNKKPAKAEAKKPTRAPRSALVPEQDAKTPLDIYELAVKMQLSPMEYMLRVMNNPTVPVERRDRLAATVAPYLHMRAEFVDEVSIKVQLPPELRLPAGFEQFTPMGYFLREFNNPATETARRDRIANTMILYMHKRKDGVQLGGKKEQQAAAARAIAEGVAPGAGKKFAPGVAPTLKVVNG
jgi:hypothetical protein